MNDACETLKINGVIIQSNGIIRNSKGYLIGRLVKEIDFNSEHLKAVLSDKDKIFILEHEVRILNEEIKELKQ